MVGVLGGVKFMPHIELKRHEEETLEDLLTYLYEDMSIKSSASPTKDSFQCARFSQALGARNTTLLACLSKTALTLLCAVIVPVGASGRFCFSGDIAW